jgi:hypothetical protein
MALLACLVQVGVMLINSVGKPELYHNQLQSIKH